MRIHTDTIFSEHLAAAAKAASKIGHGVVRQDAEMHDSRSRRHAFDVALFGDGSVQRKRSAHKWAWNGDSREYTATRDSWGAFLAHLYKIDSTMKAGPYANAQDFHTKTGWKYEA